MESLPAELGQSVKDGTIGRHVSGAVRAHGEQRDPAKLPCEMQEERERGSVGPVQVVQRQKKPAVWRRSRYVHQQGGEAFEETVALHLRARPHSRSGRPLHVGPSTAKKRGELWTDGSDARGRLWQRMCLERRGENKTLLRYTL